MATTLVSGVQYSGIWNISSQANARGGNLWPAAPGAPTIGTATIVGTSASVSFTAPSNLGNPATITSYTVTSSPGGITASGSSSPITLSGFTQGQAYTFTVTATNATGTGPASAASNSITPNPTSYLYTWGLNSYGQLGQNNTTNYSSPKQVGSTANWGSSIGGFSQSHFGITKNNGTLWMCGNNGSGELGLGNTTYYSSPKQVGALTNWSTVGVGNAFTIALKTDGTLWSWGTNGFGRLGLNNTTAYSSPKQIGALTNWSSFAIGGSFCMAIKTDGTLWGWGINGNGQLGFGNTANYYSSPKQVGALTTWLAVGCGRYSTYARKSDGTLWVWGAGVNGRLGLGNETSYSSPKQLGALTNWLTTKGGNNFGMAIKTDGTLWSWGNNGNGQLGLNNTTYYSSPKQIGGATNWSKFSCGLGQTLAITTSNRLYSWGRNQSGQLGLGNTTNYSSPMQVGILTTWLNVAASGYFSSATASA